MVNSIYRKTKFVFVNKQVLLSFILSPQLFQMLPCQLVQVTTLKGGWTKMYGCLSRLGLSTSTCLETRKEVFDKIAEQFTKISGRLVTGEQCIRQRGKITSKQKEIEDHNNKSGNNKNSWKFYEELSACLANDATVTQ